MLRAEWEDYILATYPCERVYPFSRFPTIAAFRHPHNHRGFAFFLSAPRERVGLDGEGSVEVVNLKCDPRMMGSFLSHPGVAPGYHMNKEHWISVIVGGPLPEEEWKLLLDISFETTLGKRR